MGLHVPSNKHIKNDKPPLHGGQDFNLATGVAHTCSASDGGRGRFDCDRSMGAGGPPSAGGPKERRGAPARSIASNYKVSCRA